jgi:hypothetical protein
MLVNYMVFAFSKIASHATVIRVESMPSFD